MRFELRFELRFNPQRFALRVERQLRSVCLSVCRHQSAYQLLCLSVYTWADQSTILVGRRLGGNFDGIRQYLGDKSGVYLGRV